MSRRQYQVFDHLLPAVQQLEAEQRFNRVLRFFWFPLLLTASIYLADLVEVLLKAKGGGL